jgi:hypothetical protein
MGGTDDYEEEQAKDRKETSIVEDVVCAVSEERHTVLEDGTDAQDRCRPNNKRLVFGESVLDTMILEHYQTMNEIDELQAARSRIRELEAALADTHMDYCLESVFLNIACERLGMSTEELKKRTS